MEMFAKHEIQGVISTETSIWVNTGLSAVFTTGGSDGRQYRREKRTGKRNRV